jgi:hypothetical protein
MAILTWLNLILILVVAFGGVGVSLLHSGATCAIGVEGACSQLWYDIGSNIVSPQVKMVHAVNDLSNPSAIQSVPVEFRNDYVNSKKADIAWSIVATAIWCILIAMALMKLPEMTGLGTKIVIIIATIAIVAVLQSVFAMMYMKEEFIFPFEGFIRLAMNPSVLTLEVQHAGNVAGEIVSPLPGTG